MTGRLAAAVRRLKADAAPKPVTDDFDPFEIAAQELAEAKSPAARAAALRAALELHQHAPKDS